LTTIVTAQDGVTTNTYTVTVTRAPSTNANLAAFKLSNGILSPAFAYTTTSYTASVANATLSVTVTPATADAIATVTVNGTSVTSGTASASIPLSIGPNTITTIVTAQDAITTKTYTVTVTRATGPIAIANNNFTASLIAAPANGLQTGEDGIVVHQGVSPNGDGTNDFLTVDGINSYPDNKLMIMNRNGELVFEAKGCDNSFRVFDGLSNKNSKLQQPCTYF
jgi:gliding motility-associated-like protein